MKWLGLLGLAFAIMLTSACGATNPNSAPSPSPSPASDAATHAYPAQGFSLAFGSAWRPVVQPRSAVKWHFDVTPRAEMEYFPAIEVTVSRTPEQWTPSAFQQNPPKRYSALLRGLAQNLGTEAEFEPVTLNGVPALKAAYVDDTFAHEWYLIGRGHRVYSIGGSGARSKWPAEGPKVRAILGSFTLLGG